MDENGKFEFNQVDEIARKCKFMAGASCENFHMKSMAILNLIEFVYSKQTQGEGDSLTKNLVHNKNYLLPSGMDFSFR